jgi:hypothetical protein
MHWMIVELTTTATAAIVALIIASATAAATESATTATAAEVATGTFLAGLGFVDGQSTAIDFFAVTIGNGLVGLFLRPHLNERKAAGLARELVHDEFATDDIARLLEQVENLPLGRVKREVPYEYLGCHTGFIVILLLR